MLDRNLEAHMKQYVEESRQFWKKIKPYQALVRPRRYEGVRIRKEEDDSLSMSSGAEDLTGTQNLLSDIEATGRFYNLAKTQGLGRAPTEETKFFRRC